jgi:FkbM family methyltransferase
MASLRLINRLARAWRLPRREVVRRLQREIANATNAYLNRRRRGVLHIGANEAAEASLYGDVPVIWFEADRDRMPGLLRNIAPFPHQRAFCVLLGDREGEADFHIANWRDMKGATSSVFPFGPAAVGADSLWPDADLHVERTVRLRMRKLDSVLEEHAIDPAQFDTWVMDVQGAESLVLAGAHRALASCRVILMEVSTISVYEGGALYPDLKGQLAKHQFIPLLEPEIVGMKHGDVTFIHRALIRRSPLLRIVMCLMPRN